MKLESTGREVGELRKLTTLEKVHTLDIAGATERMYTLAMLGLGLKSLNDFDKAENEYSVEEISDIAVATFEEAAKGSDPTSGD